MTVRAFASSLETFGERPARWTESPRNRWLELGRGHRVGTRNGTWGWNSGAERRPEGDRTGTSARTLTNVSHILQDVRVCRHGQDCQCYRRSRRSRAFARHCFKGRPLGPIESLNLALLVGRTRGCSGRQRAWSCRCVCNHGSWFRTCPQTPSRATSRRITRRPSPSSGPQRPPPSSKSSIKSLYLPNESVARVRRLTSIGSRLRKLTPPGPWTSATVPTAVLNALKWL